MVPRDATIAVVEEEELPAAVGFARRRGWSLEWFPDQLALVADGRHRADGSPARLHADMTGYRAVPPAWTFLDPAAECWTPGRFPKAHPLSGGIKSIFHSKGVICAPFNRLAYKDLSGPHGDWGGPNNWLEVRGHVRATNVAEMLAQIILHLRYSPGWG